MAQNDCGYETSSQSFPVAVCQESASVGLTHDRLCTEHARYTEAIAQVQRVMALIPHDQDALMLLGKCYGFAGRYHEALNTFLYLNTLYPADARAYEWLGMAYDHLRETDAAVAAYAQAILLVPDAISPRLSLACLLHRLGRDDEAVPLLREVIAFDPAYMAGYRLLGTIALSQGRPDEAAAMFREASRRCPGSPSVHEMMLSETPDLLLRAEAVLHSILEREPQHQDALSALGCVRKALAQWS